MTWEIKPRLEIGQLRLGMTPQEVGAILDPLGPVEARNQAFDGSLDEFRSLTLPICNYVDGKVAQIDTTPTMTDVMFHNTDVFLTDVKRIIELFEVENNGALVGLGFILFVNINVYLQNFYDPQASQLFDIHGGEQDHRRVAVFAAGRFDKLMPRFVPFDIASFK